MDKKSWRVDRWPPLAWIETVLKLAGMWFGFVSLVGAVRADTLSMPSNIALFQWVIFVLLSIGLIAAIWDRWQEREAIAMGFVVLNSIAHWGMVAGLMAGAVVGLQAFSVLFLAGDLVKIVFIRLHQFEVRGYGPTLLSILTGIYVIGYILILISSWI